MLYSSSSSPSQAGRRVTLPSEHKRIYLDAMQLSKSTSWNHLQIASELGRRYGHRVPSMTVYFWVTGRSNPLGHWNVFNLEPSRQLAYILGVMRGDGIRTSYRPQGKEEIRLWVKDKDFASHFNTAVAHVLEKRPNKIRREIRADKDGAMFFHVRYSSVQLAEFLDRDFDSLKPFVEAHPADYIQGFFDSDGGSSIDRSRGRLYLKLAASNTNLQTLGYVRDLMLQGFGIRSSIRIDREPGYSVVVYHRVVTKRKRTYLLEISRQDSVRAFFNLVGFSIQRKQCVLEDGFRLIDTHGRRQAAMLWPSLYEKIGRRWRRRVDAGRGGMLGLRC